FAGVALFDHVLDDPSLRPVQRLGRAWVTWAALLFPTLVWLEALTLPGSVFVTSVFAGLLAAGTLLSPVGPARALALPGAVVLVVRGIGVVAPDGAPTGEELEVAVVQGGGPQGTRAATTEPGIVLERHLEASAELDPDRDIDLLVWPEDVVDVARLRGNAAE